MGPVSGPRAARRTPCLYERDGDAFLSGASSGCAEAFARNFRGAFGVS